MKFAKRVRSTQRGDDDRQPTGSTIGKGDVKSMLISHDKGNQGHRGSVFPLNKRTIMDSLMRRIPSHWLVVGLYVALVAFAVIAFRNPV